MLANGNEVTYIAQYMYYKGYVHLINKPTILDLLLLEKHCFSNLVSSLYSVQCIKYEHVLFPERAAEAPWVVGYCLQLQE